MLTATAAATARAELARLRAARPTTLPAFTAARLARVAELEAQLAGEVEPTPLAPAPARLDDAGLARWDAAQLAAAGPLASSRAAAVRALADAWIARDLVARNTTPMSCE